MVWHDTNLKRNRDKLITFYLSDEELEVFNERFAKYKTDNRSQFIRDSVLNNYMIINDDTNLRKLVYEVNQIGNNVNQLAHLANQNKKIEKEEIENLQNEVKEIRSLVFHSLMKHNEKR